MTLIIYILLIILPLVFFPYCYEMADLPKIAFLGFFTVIGLGLFLISAYKEGKLKVYKSIFYLPLFFIFLSLLLSSIFSISFAGSIYGSYGGKEGLIPALIFILFYFVFANTIKKKQINNIILCAIFGGVIVAIIGLFEYFVYRKRVISTIGSPTLLGGYLSILLPLCVINFFTTSKITTRILLISFFCLIYLCIIFTFSRGALLTTFTSIFLLSSLLFYYFRKDAYKVLPFLIMWAILIVFTSKQKVNLKLHGKESTVEDRIATIARLEDPTIITRLSMWKSGLFIIRDYPIVGCGLDTIPIVFPTYQNKVLCKYEGRFTTIGKLHNIFLQISATQGLVGLFLFVWLCLIVLQKNFYLTNRKHEIIHIGLNTCLIAYLLQAQFTLNTPSSNLLFWTILVLTEVSNRDEDKYFTFNISRIKPIFFGTMIFGLFLVSNYYIFSPFLSDIYYKVGMKNFNDKKFLVAEDYLEKAVILNPYEFVYNQQLGITYAYNNKIKLATQYLKIAFSQNMNDPAINYNLGRLYEEEKKIDKAIFHYEHALKICDNMTYEKNDIPFYGIMVCRLNKIKSKRND